MLTQLEIPYTIPGRFVYNHLNLLEAIAYIDRRQHLMDDIVEILLTLERGLNIDNYTRGDIY